MKQEDKDLLLKDLCARLPYSVKCKYYDCCEGDYNEGTICGFERKEYIQIDGVCIHIEEVKPYLFPLSNMTEEQKEELKMICDWHDDEEDAQSVLVLYHKHFVMKSDVIDWFNKNHFDWRGLIPKGLANDATGLNIY